MNKRDHASTFAKGLAVLACFESGARDLTMADIGKSTGFDRAVVRRLCLTLEAEGYLVRAGKFLRLTPQILSIAGGYLAAEGVGRVVQPVLDQFAEDLNGEIALAVLTGNQATYVASSAVGSARKSLGFSVGSTLPLLPTAVGTMLLGLCNCVEREQIIKACLVEAFTPKTEMDKASILRRIEEAELAGYAYVSGEFEASAAGLAVPVKALSGAPAVLSTSATATFFMNAENRERALEVLFEGALALRDGR